MRNPILLDPDLFMALGLSAEAHGGIGRDRGFDDDDIPLCIRGHAWWLDLTSAKGGRVDAALCASFPYSAGLALRGALFAQLNDDRLRDAGVGDLERVSFVTWCELVGVDVRDA